MITLKERSKKILFAIYTTLILLGMFTLWDLGVVKPDWAVYPLPFEVMRIPKWSATVASVIMILSGLAMRRSLLRWRRLSTKNARKLEIWVIDEYERASSFLLYAALTLIGTVLLVDLAIFKDYLPLYPMLILGNIPKYVAGDIGFTLISAGLVISWFTG